jgi:hypothetical protein
MSDLAFAILIASNAYFQESIPNVVIGLLQKLDPQAILLPDPFPSP